MDYQLKALADAIAATNKFIPISGFAAKPANEDENDFRIRDYAELRCEAAPGTTDQDFRQLAGYVLSQFMQCAEQWQTILHICKDYVGSPDDVTTLEEYIVFRFTPFNVHTDPDERVSDIETMVTLAAEWVRAAFDESRRPAQAGV